MAHADVRILDRNIPLNGSSNIMGRAIVIHSLKIPVSQNSKLACGVIVVLAE
jgi:hypothetical protein